MANDHDIDELKARRLCYKCIGEEYLSNEVRLKGNSEECFYCGEDAASYSIAQVALHIEAAFAQHFRRTSDEPDSWEQAMLSDRESDYQWERSGESVTQAIENAAEVPEEAARDMQTVLDAKHGDFEARAMGEETEFCSESCYEEKGPDDQVWQEQWRHFERSLKTEARFFSRSAAAHLESIFKGIDKMSTIDGAPLVIDAGPDTPLTGVFRARVFQSDEGLKEALCRPDRHLGSPPAACSIAGRMNPAGISVFYGAEDPNVAIAEVRPPVGSQVMVARFDIIRPLRLLDLGALTKLTENGSIFDLDWAPRLDRVAFLRSLSERITKPVMPDDEVFEYLPTQAIADFLATENAPVLDGVLFPSVQVTDGGLNVVLFHKAARVETLDIPEGTKLESSIGHWSDDGWEVEYSVAEQVPPMKTSEEKDEKCRWVGFADLVAGMCAVQEEDFRVAALRVDLKSAKVYAVRGVNFECQAYDVWRHRWSQNNDEF